MNQEIEIQVKLKLAIYARKSSEPDDKQVLSTPAQLKEVGELVSNLEIKPVKNFEEAKSAKYPDKRPLFSEMLANIESGVINSIACWHPDRLSRNPIEAGKLVYLMDMGKLVKVITPTQTFTNTPMDKFMLQFLMLTAKLENDNKGVNVKRGMRAKLESGGYPFVARQGYLNTPALRKGEKAIVKDPERFDLVRKMWILLLTGAYTVPQILNIINNDWGYKTLKHSKMGGKPLSRSALYDLYTSPFYYGWFKVNGKWYKGNHEPMITKDEFDKAQSILRRFDAPRAKSIEHIFSGLIRCGECGCAITETHKEKFYPKTKNQRTYVYLHCTHKRRDYKCKQNPITLHDFQNQICELLGDIEIPSEFRDWAIKYLKERAEYEKDNVLAIIKSQQGAGVNVEERLQKLLAMRLNDEISAQEYSDEKGKLQASRESINQSISNVQVRVDKYMADMEDVFDFASSARNKFENGELFEKREVIAKLGQNLLIKDEKVTVELKKAFLQFKKSKSVVESDLPKLEPVDLVGVSAETARLANENLIWLLR